MKPRPSFSTTEKPHQNLSETTSGGAAGAGAGSPAPQPQGSAASEEGVSEEVGLLSLPRHILKGHSRKLRHFTVTQTPERLDPT